MSKINRKHIVKQTVFEIEVEKKEDVDGIQSNFSRLFNSRLLRIMDRVFSEFSDDKIQHRLKYLEIDLGTIDNRYFDKQVEERFEEQLRAQLRDIIHLEQVRYSNQTVKLEKVPVEQSDLQVVLYFLETGRLKSWKAVSGTSIETLFKNLISQKSEPLKKALEIITKKRGVLKRMNEQFSKDTIHQVFKFVTPRSFSYIGKETRALERQFNKAAPVAGMPPSKFGKVLRAAVLQYLFEEKKGSFNKKAFLKSLEKQIKIRTGIEKEELLKPAAEIQKEQDLEQLKEFAKSESQKLKFLIQWLAQEKADVSRLNLSPKEIIKLLQSEGWKLKHGIEGKKGNWKTVIERLATVLPKENTPEIEEFIEFLAELQPLGRREEVMDELLPVLEKTKEEIEKIKAKKSLEEQRRKARKDNTEAEPEETTAKVDLEILFYIFKEGKLPWWAPKTVDSVDTILKRVIKEAPKELKKSWTTGLSQAPATRKKQMIQFLQKELTQPTIEDFLEVLEPDFIGFILTQALALEKIAEVRDPWIPVLTYFVDKGTRPFQLPTFVEASIKVVAEQIAKPYKELVNEVLSKIKVAIQQKQPRFIPLESILKTLASTDTTKETPAIDLPEDVIPETADQPEEDSPFELLLSKSFNTPEELTIEEALEMIEYFLEKGVLPPPIASFTMQQLEKLFEIALKEKPLSARDILIRQLIKKQTRVMAVDHFSNPILLKFLARVQPTNKPFYEFSKVVLEVASKVKSTLIVESIKDFLLQYAVSAKSTFDLMKTYRSMIKHIAREQSILLKEIAEQLVAAFRKVTGKTETSAPGKKKKTADPKNLTESIQQLTEALVIEYERRPQRKFEPQDEEALERKRQATVKDDDPVFIQNSGIVLLYPLMRIAFKMLGYLTPLRTFKDKHSVFRAIYFLQYVATKQYKNVPEYMLILNKLLCGVPLDIPLETGIELTDKEKEMSDELIRQLIMQWPMMKNSSVDGLRGSFMMREGSLVKKGNVWVLSVSPESFDLVLQSYPWGLAIIKFPWMEEYSISAEWGSTLF